MLNCQRCNSRIFIDRQYTTTEHIETYCISCGNRKFFHPPSESAEGRWLLQKEKQRAKHTIVSL